MQNCVDNQNICQVLYYNRGFVEIAKRGTCTRTITASIKSLSGVIKNKPRTPHSPHPKNETGFCMFESDNKHSLSIELYIHVTICS